MTTRARRAAPRLAPAQDFIADAQPRDFEAAREVIEYADGMRLILREAQSDSHSLYTAWEPSGFGRYQVLQNFGRRQLGRADTRRFDGETVPPISPNWLAHQAELFAHAVKQSAKARELIRAACPETVDGYDRPDGVLLFRPRPVRRRHDLPVNPPQVWGDGRGG